MRPRARWPRSSSPKAAPRDCRRAVLSGLVLAGGRSRRMGADKAILHVDCERLIDRTVRILQSCCAEVLVASGDGRRLSGLEVSQIADAMADTGPLGGLVAGLQVAAHDLVAVV